MPRRILTFMRPTQSAALWALVANLMAALFEGGTLGILSIAFHVLGQTAGASPEPVVGGVGTWLPWLQLGGNPELVFLQLVLLAVITQVLRSGAQFAGEVLTVRLQVQVHTEAYHQVFATMMRLSFPRASAYSLGSLTESLRQTEHVVELFNRLNSLVRNSFFLLIYGALLFWLSWPMTLVVLAAYWLVSGLFRWVIQMVKRHAGHYLQATLALTQSTTELFQALRLIHTVARQEDAIRSVERLTRDKMASRRIALVWGGLVEPLTDILTVIGMGAFLIGGYMALAPRGLIALPTLLAFLLAFYRVAPRLRSIQGNLATVASLMPSLVRLCDVLDQELHASASAGRQPWDGLREAIEFRNVTFCYHPDESPAVVDVSVRLPRGQWVGLVGSSGAGKSTVVDLLLGLLEPTSGQIVTDGRDLRHIELSSWRRRFGVVSQEPFFFHASIRENIAYGKPDATMEEIVAAAQAAHADEFIARFSNGYETVVGERGDRLSGGQRQRIALARALVRQPDILILDEATSALDSESERLIQLALDEQRGVRTVLVIAHRLSTVVRADHLLVLAEGKLIEQGTHQELLACHGLYARLWQLQAEGQEPLIAVTPRAGDGALRPQPFDPSPHR